MNLSYSLFLVSSKYPIFSSVSPTLTLWKNPSTQGTVGGLITIRIALALSLYLGWKYLQVKPAKALFYRDSPDDSGDVLPDTLKKYELSFYSSENVADDSPPNNVASLYSSMRRWSSKFSKLMSGCTRYSGSNKTCVYLALLMNEVSHFLRTILFRVAWTSKLWNIN